MGDFFALDIGTTAVRVVQLHKSGDSWSLVKYGLAPVDIRVAASDAPEDQRRLGETINNLISQTGINVRNVVVGVPSNKAFITVVELPEMPAQELASTIKYQAEQYIPMPIEEVKMDWAVLGRALHDASKVEVLLASVTKKFSESRMEMIEGLGLNVVAIEPDPLALVRSLITPADKDAHLIVDIGDSTTDIVAVLAGAPRLVRSLPTGMQTLLKVAMQNLNVDANQAMQFILKFGMAPDRLEGQVVRALDSTMDQFSGEVEKSVKFFLSRYTNVQIKSLVLSGYAQAIPAFDQYLASKVGLQAVAGDAWANVHHSPSLNDSLAQIGPHFAVAVGLAERTI